MGRKIIINIGILCSIVSILFLIASVYFSKKPSDLFKASLPILILTLLIKQRKKLSSKTTL